MHALVAAAQRRMQVEAQEPPVIHTLEEMNAYVATRVAEIDALIVDCEKEVAKLDAKEKVVRAWFSGLMEGIQLARAAWSWWGKEK